MAICEMHYNSDSLQKMVSAMVIIPENLPGPWPVLYLLHGLSDDHTGWARRTSIDRYVRETPLMVVMPDGERSLYTDSVCNPLAAFETFIIKDTINFIDNTFHTIPNREGRAICGLSMGGYGAFKLSIKHPDLFRAAASLSGAFQVQPVFEGFENRKSEIGQIFGESFIGGPEDVNALIETADQSTLPALWMHCGSEDFLIQVNRDMHAHLESLGIPHEYAEAPGEHTWEYWDEHIVEALSFIKGKLGI